MGKWVMPSDAPQWLDLERWNKEQKKIMMKWIPMIQSIYVEKI